MWGCLIWSASAFCIYDFFNYKLFIFKYFLVLKIFNGFTKMLLGENKNIQQGK